MRKTLAGVLVVGLIVTAAGPASAAGHHRATPNALTLVHHSVHQTEAAGSAHLSDLLQIQEGSGQPSATWSVGDLTFPGPNVTMTIWDEFGGQSAGPPTAAIIIDKSYYSQAGPLTSGPWLEQTQRKPYPLLGSVTAAGLEHTRGPVGIVGSEVVNGEPATEYSLHLPAEHRTIRRSNLVLRISLQVVSFDLWLDTSGRIVQAAEHVVAIENGIVSQNWSAVALSNFGERVKIVRPKDVVRIPKRPRRTASAGSGSVQAGQR